MAGDIAADASAAGHIRGAHHDDIRRPRGHRRQAHALANGKDVGLLADGQGIGQQAVASFDEDDVRQALKQRQGGLDDLAPQRFRQGLVGPVRHD
ncbi:hypothetical protein D3C72_1701530 [compost metagenome]